jgi:hypothetical protein
MVASTGKGQIDLSTLSVTGKAKAAVKGDAPGAVIAAPAVAGQLTVVPPATSNEPLVNRKPVADVPAAAAAPATAADPTAAKPAAPAAAAEPAVELHGGSVPPPAQKVPGQ